MADNWQETTSQQVKLIADRLNELLSGGLDLMRSELGVDLGLQPELYPPWVILLAACIGLVLMVALWASACRGVFKKRPTITVVDDGKPAVTKPTRNDEPKKKKRKIAEKKLQSNGRAAAETQEEVQVVEEDVPHHPSAEEAKTEKAFEVKKAKKKPKQAGKEGKAATAVGKEPEEGTWETKVSNKEKREQRRKDKTPGDGSGSPGGGDPPPKHAPSEQPKAAASLSGGQKKKKESSKARAEKGDVVTPQVDSSEVVEVSAGWTDLTDKTPANAIGPGPDHWASNQGPALGTPAPTKRCSLETEGSWTVIDATEISLAERGVSSAAVEPLPGTDVVDEWSGLNGASADPSSDWNVPSEAWVNEEETPPTPEETPPPQEELPPEPAKGSDGEKDKADSQPDGNGKLKKKKKKKKKQAEDGGVAVQEGEEPETAGEAEAAVKMQPVQEAAPSVQAASAAAPPAAVEEVQTPPAVTQVPQTPAEAEPPAKQNTLPDPSQTEEKPSRTVKKKRARRET